VSRDTIESHAGFRSELELPFPLLADTDEALSKAYGTLYEREDDAGKKYIALQRSTFLIDPQGVIRHVWPKVSVPDHAADVLATLRGLAGAH
jgi:thioredoxin-dependent peroxiredoxin